MRRRRSIILLEILLDIVSNAVLDEEHLFHVNKIRHRIQENHHNYGYEQLVLWKLLIVDFWRISNSYSVIVRIFTKVLLSSISKPSIKLNYNFQDVLEDLLQQVSKTLLNCESKVHFEELSEEILNTEQNKKIAQLKIWKLVILEMWLENLYAETIWFPYISKIWLFVETQIIGIFSRF